ncbi:hypothetical protein V1527DRAFT_269898 [Lipomyces starkeyi]
MELLGDEDRALIPSETEDGPDVAMMDDNDDNGDRNVSDEPSLPHLPPEKTASKSRSRPAKSATKRPKNSSKTASPRSSSSATSTPDVTTTTIETTFTDPDRMDLVSKFGFYTRNLSDFWPNVRTDDHGSRAQESIQPTNYHASEISVVEDPLNPKY